MLTLRGAELVGRADVVVHSGDVHEETIARAKREADVVAIARGTAVEQVASLLVEKAREGKSVVRLFSGDPMLFASGDTEVAIVARQGVAIEIVAGVIVPTAAAAYTGLALSSPEDASPSVAFAVVSQVEQLHDWKVLSLATDTLALLIDAEHVEEITETLTYYGRAPDTPAAIVRNASLPSQRVACDTLVAIRKHAPSFAPGQVLLLVGAPLAQREGLRWFDTRPLFGKRVLLTRPRGQGERTAALLRERGAEPVVLPTIAIHPPADPARLDAAVRDLRAGAYTLVAFTSANGVERTWEAIVAVGADARAFGAARLAAIGPATARALEGHGLRPDVLAKEFVGEGLAEAILAAVPAAGDVRPRALLARAAKARDALPEALRAGGWDVDVVAAYETRAPGPEVGERLAEALEGPGVDAVVFTSSSTVDNLCDLVGDRAAELLARVRVASIGPVTSATAAKRGLRVDVTAAEYTLPGLVRALEESWG